jgi:hypothetical protein
MADDFVQRREFERAMADHERRLDGHDSLYSDVREAREELARFSETLRQARHEIGSGTADRDKCRVECASNRTKFDDRLRVLERFRWQIGGALVLIAAVPSWTAVILLLAGR